VFPVLPDDLASKANILIDPAEISAAAMDDLDEDEESGAAQVCACVCVQCVYSVCVCVCVIPVVSEVKDHG